MSTIGEVERGILRVFRLHRLVGRTTNKASLKMEVNEDTGAIWWTVDFEGGGGMMSSLGLGTTIEHAEENALKGIIELLPRGKASR